VSIFDQGESRVTQKDMVAFTRSINNFPVYCIFNFGTTPKEVEINFSNLLPGRSANFLKQIYFSHNISIKPGPDQRYTITMPQYSSVVFTPIEFIGIVNGGQA